MKLKLLAALLMVTSFGIASTAMAAPAWMGDAQLPAPQGCAPLQWNLANIDGRLHGIIWFTDGAGFGSAIGTADPNTGAFTITITPVLGSSAPSGVMTGTVDNGEVHVQFHGGKCADFKAVFKEGSHHATPE